MILSHKFEYGYNPAGGRKWASLESSQRENLESKQIKQILTSIPANYSQCVENKAVDTKQNFSIKPVQELTNGVTKHIGEGANSPIKNEIDARPLRATNVYVR